MKRTTANMQKRSKKTTKFLLYQRFHYVFEWLNARKTRIQDSLILNKYKSM